MGSRLWCRLPSEPAQTKLCCKFAATAAKAANICCTALRIGFGGPPGILLAQPVRRCAKRTNFSAIAGTVLLPVVNYPSKLSRQPTNPGMVVVSYLLEPDGFKL